MSTSHHRPLWQRLFRSPEAVHEHDAADMGTAIGLDFVLDEPPLPSRAGTPVRTADATPTPRFYD
jgi:hypothetical protein